VRVDDFQELVKSRTSAFGGRKGAVDEGLRVDDGVCRDES